MISYDNNLDNDIHHRLLLAIRCYLGLKKQIKSQYNRKIKRNANCIKLLIRPVLLYRCETWASKRYNEEKITIFERKVLRKIMDQLVINGRWRIRYNNEVYKLFGEPDIIREIKA
jgi:hypothetical protein